MLIEVLKSKISYATLTQTELYYEGSITIDEEIMEQANLRENEVVQILNLNTGSRFQTYVIKGERHKREFCLNGPAARLGQVKDQIFILSFVYIEDTETIIPKLIDLREES